MPRSDAASAVNTSYNRPRWRLRLLACGGAVALGVAAALMSGRSATPALTSNSPSDTVASPVRAAEDPPKFVASTPTKQVVQVNPTAPDYDFEKVYRVMDGDIAALHEAEPKDSTWAPPMEKRGTEYLGRDFRTTGIMARMTEIDCRTTTCRVVVKADTKRDLDMAVAMLQDFRIGDYAAVMGSPEGVENGVVVYYGFSQKWRALSRHDESYNRYRSYQLQLMKRIKNQRGAFDYTVPNE